MNIPSSSTILRRPRFLSSSSPSTTTTFDIKTQVHTILKTLDPIEKPLDSLVPFLSHNVVTCVLQEQQQQDDNNLESSFRFFIWAMKKKQFRSWVSHNLMIQMVCGGFELAWKLLEELKNSGIMIVPQAFTVLISAYMKLGMAEKAVESFGRMKEFNCRPNTFTYNTILHILVKKQVIILAEAVYNQMLKTGCSPNQATFGILIDGLCKAGKTKDALQLYDEMAKRGISPNTMIYTIVISGLCQAKRTDDAHRLLHKMKSNACVPDFITYNVVLNGFCKLGRIDESLELLESFKEEEGFVLGLHGYSCLIDGFFRAGRFDEACQWYKKMMFEANILPDCVLYTIMIKGFTEAGKLQDASNLLKEMTQNGFVPDTLCYNTLIKGCCDAGLLNKAQSLKLEISKHDSATYTILICGFCKEGLVVEAQHIFEEMEKYGCDPTVMTFNALIDGLCKAGDLTEALKLYHKMETAIHPSLCLRLTQGAGRVLDSASLQELVERGLILKAYKLLVQLADWVAPNIVTFNILINGLCQARNTDGALNLFKLLPRRGFCPDAVTYGTLINGLQMVNEEEHALGVFEQMVNNRCTPTLTVYKILMTWMCRKGKVDLAFGYWLKYVRGLTDREEATIQMVEDNFKRGDVEAVTRGLLEMDLKSKIVDPSPYTIWLIGLCQQRRVHEGLKIFSVLEEYKIDVTPPSCVMLIKGLCQEGEVGLARDVFLYTLEKGYMLMPPVCNRLISCLCSQDKNHALDLLSRMRYAGYNLEVYLNHNTKTQLHGHALESHGNSNGRLAPVQVHVKNDKSGLGAEKVKKRVVRLPKDPSPRDKDDTENLQARKKAKTASKRIRKMLEEEKACQEKEFERAFFRESSGQIMFEESAVDK